MSTTTTSAPAGVGKSPITAPGRPITPIAPPAPAAPSNSFSPPTDMKPWVQSSVGASGAALAAAFGFTNAALNVTGADIFTLMDNPDKHPAKFIVGQHAIMQSGEVMAWKGDPSAYTVIGTSLQLSTHASTSKPGALTEADIESVLDYGPNFYAELGWTGPQQKGSHSGVWFLSKDNGKSDLTGGHVEVDLVEQYEPNDQFDHSAIHYWPGSRKDFQHTYKSVLNVRPEGKAMHRHVYGLLALDSAFVIFRDGVILAVHEREAYAKRKMYPLISLFGNTGATAGETAVIDYLQVFTAA